MVRKTKKKEEKKRIKSISKPGDRPSFTAGRKRVGKAAFEEATSKQKLGGSLEKAKKVEGEVATAQLRRKGKELQKPIEQKPIEAPGKKLEGITAPGKLSTEEEPKGAPKPIFDEAGKVTGFDFPKEEGQGIPPELAFLSTPGAFRGAAPGALKVSAAAAKNNFPKYEQSISRISRMSKTARKTVENRIKDEIIKIETKKYAENVLGKKILGISPKKLALGITTAGLFGAFKFVDFTSLIQWFALDNVIGQSERRVRDFRDDVQFRGLDPAEALRLAQEQRDNVEIARETVIEINSINPLAWKFRKIILAGADASFDAMDRTILELEILAGAPLEEEQEEVAPFSSSQRQEV